MSYTPGALPKEAPPWITRELLAIAEAAVAAQPTVTFDTTYNDPGKPRGGQFYVADGTTWNPGYGAGPYIYLNSAWVPMFGAAVVESAIIACSDETTAITTGTAKRTFRMPYGATLVALRASVNTAPTGATIIVDVNQNGPTVLSTRLTIDTSEKTSYTAATPVVISTTALSIDDEISIDFDQVGSTVAGTGLKVTFFWLRTVA